jgi:hypothetical protein
MNNPPYKCKHTKQSISDTQKKIEYLLRENDESLHRIKFGIQKIENELNHSYDWSNQPIETKYRPQSKHKNENYARYLSPELYDNDYMVPPSNHTAQQIIINDSKRIGLTPLYEILDVSKDIANQRVKEARKLIVLLGKKKISLKKNNKPMLRSIQSKQEVHNMSTRNIDRRDRAKTMLAHHSLILPVKKECDTASTLLYSALKNTLSNKVSDKVTKICFLSIKNFSPNRKKPLIVRMPPRILEPLKLSCINIRPTETKTLRVIDQYKSLKSSLLSIGTAHPEVVLL